MRQRNKARNGCKKSKCINPDCRSVGNRKDSYVKGLCENCYRALLRLIARGKIASLKEAEDLGMCKPAKEPGSSRFPVVANRKQTNRQ